MNSHAPRLALTVVIVAALAAPAVALAQTVPQPTAPAPATTVTATDQATPAKPAEKKDKGESPTVEGIFKNGFSFRTADRQNELRLQGSFAFDYRAYGGDSVAPSSFDVRNARVEISGKLRDFISFRLQLAMEDSPYIRNAFADVSSTDAFHLRIGQAKVPFSTQWLTEDGQVDFLERGSAEPIYPFIDRGVTIWGSVARKVITYNVGVFNGSGIDSDYTKGDIDDSKDVAVRLFLQPFRNMSSPALEGLYLVAQGTYGNASVPTTRYETKGLVAADYESEIWRWRTEQQIGSNGRNTDQISGQIDSRERIGAELNYIYGPLSAGVEWAKVHYDGIQIYHDFFVGSKRLKHDPVLTASGDVKSISAVIGYFLTGEKKLLDNFGWRQPTPTRPFWPGNHNPGAWEILARFSRTTTDPALFASKKVSGYRAADLGSGVVAVGDSGSVTAAVLDGATVANEATVGVNWTLNYNFRILFDVETIWAPDYANGVGGLVSAANSQLGDPVKKNRIVERENMAGLRFIFRL